MSLCVPYLVIAASDLPEEEDDFAVVMDNTATGTLWLVGNASFVNQWDYRTVMQAYEGNDTWAARRKCISCQTPMSGSTG
jgi:hypothetical protein